MRSLAVAAALLGCQYFPIGTSPNLDAEVTFTVTEGQWILRQGRIMCGYPTGDGDMVYDYAQTRGHESAWSFEDEALHLGQTPICAAAEDLSKAETCSCAGPICLAVDGRPICRAERYLPVLAASLWENARVVGRSLGPRGPNGALRIRWPERNRLIIDHFHTAALQDPVWSVVDHAGTVHDCQNAAPPPELPWDLSKRPPGSVSVSVVEAGAGCDWVAGHLRVGPRLLREAHKIRLRWRAPLRAVIPVTSSTELWLRQVEAELNPER